MNAPPALLVQVNEPLGEGDGAICTHVDFTREPDVVFCRGDERCQRRCPKRSQRIARSRIVRNHPTKKPTLPKMEKQCTILLGQITNRNTHFFCIFSIRAQHVFIMITTSHHRVVDLARKIQAAKPWFHQYFDPAIGTICGFVCFRRCVGDKSATLHQKAAMDMNKSRQRSRSYS